MTSGESVINRAVTYTFESSPTCTPSSRNSISASTELCHRLHGTSLLSSASTLLRMNSSTYTTSCTIFHRFFHRCSLIHFDVWSISMACTLIAGKIEEDPRRIREIIMVYSHLFRRRRLVMAKDDIVTSLVNEIDNIENELNDEISDDFRPISALTTKLTLQEKENVLRHVPPMSMFGRAYKEWKDALCTTENIILRELGFTLYWIPNSHPHKFILYFARVVEVDNEVAQRAWNYCNDSCRLDICVRFDAEVTACAAIYMAARDKNIELPMEPRPWWEVFIGPGKNDDFSLVCNAILALTVPADKSDPFSILSRKALTMFIPSLKKDGSFNDPGSFLWFMMDSIEKSD